MKFNVTARVSGIQAARRRFKQISAIPNDIIKQTAVEQKAIVEKRIRDTKQDPDGRPWQPWAMATIRQRQREGSIRGGLLYRTGRLASSIAYRISAKTLTIFSKVPYAKYLQFGTTKMPARPFLGWDKASINRIKELFKQNLEKK